MSGNLTYYEWKAKIYEALYQLALDEEVHDLLKIVDINVEALPVEQEILRDRAWDQVLNEIKRLSNCKVPYRPQGL